MSDLIERQAAIDAINNAFDRETLLTGFVRSVAVRAIRDLPSAQPEIIRCKDCEHYDEGMCRRWKYSHVTAGDSFCCSAEPRLHITEYIPEAWIENEIEWLRGLGSPFASLTAMNIEAMLKRWREQLESEEEKMGEVGRFDLKRAIREITLQVLKEYGFMPNKDEENKHDAIREGAESGVSGDAQGLEATHDRDAKEAN